MTRSIRTLAAQSARRAEAHVQGRRSERGLADLAVLLSLRPLLAFRLLMAAMLLLLVPSVTLAGARPIVVTRALLWASDGLQTGCEVVIRDGRVSAVGDSGRLERPEDALVIDAAGDTLLPGLVDAHVHLVQGSRLPAGTPHHMIHRANARALLRSGVTTGRIHLMPLPDLLAAKAMASEGVSMPRLQLAGPALYGGRPDWQDPAANVWGVRDAADAVSKVRQLREAGAAWIALHDLTEFLPGEAEAIIAEARKLELGVLAAGESFAEIERALALGVDSIEYQDRSESSAHPPDLLRQLSAHPQTLLVPMIGFPRRWTAYRQGEFAVDDPGLTELLPREIARFAVKALQDDRALQPAYTPKFDEAQIAKFQELQSERLPLVAGTDCGSPAHFHVDAIWQELEAWREFGVAPTEAVRGATERAARLLRMSDIGHLRVGARGDFVLYRGSIDQGPFHYQRVRAVAKDGVLFVNEGRWSEPDDGETRTTRTYATNAGPLEITLRGRSVTGRYRISVKEPADEGTFFGTLEDGLLDATWTEPEKGASGRMLLAFNAELTRFHCVYRNSLRPSQWFGDWFGHDINHVDDLPEATQAGLQSDWR